jgi:hexokinase
MTARAHDLLTGTVAALTPSTTALRGLSAAFEREIAQGLAGHPSSLKLLRTFVQQPRGDERGEVLFLDWGGTHGRAGRVALDGTGRVALLREEVVTWSAADKVSPVERALDVIAAALGRVAGPAPGSCPLGFAYSFPARLERIDRAVALGLTKGWRIAGLEGRDVVDLLHRALARRGVDAVRVSAVANDTVAAMALLGHRARGRDRRARPADIGLIVGTGTNQAADFGALGIRNLESGNFDGVDAVEAPCDVTLDREVTDPPPGAQRFEKMAAGHYLGEIVRRLVSDVGSRGALFHSWTAAAFRTPFGLDTANLSRIAADAAPELADTARVLEGLGVSSSTREREALATIVRGVVSRSARLVAAALLGTLRHLDPGLAAPHRIAVDGSLYGGFPGYARLVRAALAEQAGAGPAARIELEFVKDSTALGAAVIAAVARDDARGALSSG